jgi:hypothetical protein
VNAPLLSSQGFSHTRIHMKNLLISIIRVQKGNFAIIYKMTPLPQPQPPAPAHPFELEKMEKILYWEER